MNEHNRKVTIKDIASSAGVSLATVSRALRDDRSIGIETRQRIRDLAASMSYTPNRFGAALSTGRTHSILFIVPYSLDEVPHMFHMQVLEGVAEEVAGQGYKVEIMLQKSLASRGETVMEAVRQSHVDGAVILLMHADEIALGINGAATPELEVPVVFVNVAIDNLSADCVLSDDRGGARLATSRLLEAGHRDIAHLGGSDRFSSSIRRREGYADALAEHGVAFREELTVRAEMTRAGGYQAARKLLSAGIPFSAVFCGVDIMAVGAMDAFREAGFSIPDDISITAFDDDVFSAMVQPPLTTVRKPRIDMGREAARMLMARIFGDVSAPRASRVLETLLVERGSVAGPGAGAPRRTGLADRTKTEGSILPAKKNQILVSQFLRPNAAAALSAFGDVLLNTRGKPYTEDEMIELGRNADAFISPFAEPHRIFSKRVLDAVPGLKVIGWVGAGFDHIDLDEATKRGIYVTFNDVQCETVADQALALMLCAAKRLVPATEAVRSGEWERRGYDLYRAFLGTNLHDKVVGIAGFGRIGAGVARRARGFNTRVIYYDARRRPDVEKELGVEAVDFDTLLRESDFISCNLPHNAQTTRIFDASAFARMKPNCTFVNTSRGSCVDTEALYEALRTQRIEMAAVDVIDPEPFPTDHPIMSLPNFILTPHNAGMTRETEERQHNEVVAETIRVLNGFRPHKLLNPEVLKVRPLPSEEGAS